MGVVRVFPRIFVVYYSVLTDRLVVFFWHESGSICDLQSALRSCIGANGG
jgi:hypothetical protein